MKRRLAVFGVTLALALMAFAPGAQATSSRDWSGLTSQGYPVQFTVVKFNGQSVVTRWHIGFLELCLKSGTVMHWDITYGVGMKVVKGKFHYADDMREFPGFLYLGVNGRIDHGKATGTAKLLVANITPKLKAEICTSGSSAWTATPGGSMAGAHATGAEIRISVVRHPDGTITRSMRGLSG